MYTQTSVAGLQNSSAQISAGSGYEYSPASFSTSPSSYSAAPSFWNQITSGIGKVFTTENIGKVVSAGASYVQMKYGGQTNKPGEQTQPTLGEVNPAPGDWLGGIKKYLNSGTPNQPMLQSTNMNMIFLIGGGLLLLLVIMSRR